uniref:SAM-dependent MTase RsmB/NOP-type domain-containing protein n=1 Tax=Aureoumbra lagunensis TaxID=44058 RepID=A0A7S3K789_9STRA
MEFKRNGGNVIEQKDANQENRRRRFARLNPLAGADLDTIKKQLDAHLIQDTHVPNLIEFPSSFATTLNASHSLVTCGHLILQDKSSCFPALALIGEKWSGGDILDCCAAPGNKSTHLAALIKGSKSRVIALDRDPQRFDVLKQRIIEARASDTIETRLFDCLALEPHHIPNVTAVLLDPSCSGSGIPGSSARTLKSERLAALASFQLTALTKFLTCFPAVDKVVYSTCSIHHVENEQVIAKALQATQGTFELVHCLPSWTRRGSATIDGLPEHLASRCLRVDPQFDAMTGFFVALFQRVKPSSNSLLLPPSLIFKQRQQEKRNMKRKLKRLKGRRARNIDTPTTTSSIPTTVPPPIETVTRKRRRTTKKKSADYDQDSGCSLVATKKRCLFSS